MFENIEDKIKAIEGELELKIRLKFHRELADLHARAAESIQAEINSKK